MTNDGPSEARRVEVTDDLPAGLTFVSADGDGWTCAEVARVVTCDLAGPLAAGTSATPISLVVTVEPGAYPGVDNTAVVDSTTPETDPSDNTSADHVPVPPLVDLAISKSHRDPVRVGHQATYRLTVVNQARRPTRDRCASATRSPTGLTFVSATGDGWECSEARGTVTCVDADGLAVDERSTIRLVVSVGASAYPSVVNVASVASDAEDTDPDNAAATDPAKVQPSVELTVDKTALSLTRTTAAYRITVGNRGPNDTTTPIVLVDNLPSELSYVKASGPGWSCQAAGKAMTCNHPDTLRVGRATSFVLTAPVAAGATGEVVNRVVVTGGHTGRDPRDVAVGNLPPLGPPSPTGTSLPNTGGPALAWLVAAMACLAAGGVLLARSRRSG